MDPRLPPPPPSMNPPAPRPVMNPGNVNTIAMLCHLLGFAGYLVPFGSIIGPLVLWLVKRQDHPFIDENGKESVNFQISILIYFLCCIPLMFILIGFALALAVAIFAIVEMIIAAIKTSKGEPFRYPFTIRLIK